MTISTFGELKTAITAWLGLDTQDINNRIPEFVAMAEDRIAKDLRVAAMETTTDLTISSQRVSFPTGFLEARRLYLDSDSEKPLDYFSPSVFWARQFANESGKPKAFTIEGQEFVFAPSPGQTYTGKLLYYKRFTALALNTDTNWIITNARGLLLYGALLEAFIFLEDTSEAQKYAALFDQMMKATMDADRLSQYPRGALVSRSQAMVV
jgi:hypothetical protein